MIRSDSILPQRINLGTLDDPIGETSLWIVKVIGGVYKVREKPILKRKVQEFFPFTPRALFQTAFTKVLAEGKIKEFKKASTSTTGYLKV